jgi:two-component system, NarL family, nitrate/nitrite response regulator NarL
MTRVIIADDHPFLREGVRAVLTEAGLDVAAAVGDGDDALDAIDRHDPDVAILDVRMPGRDGIDALQAMRRKGDQRPVILLTAVIEDRQLLEAMRAGVNGIVFKQGGENQLIEALEIVTKGGNAIPADLIGRALDHSQKPVAVSPMARLNERERQITEGVCQGKRNREIAEGLGVSEGSIKVALHRIYDKLDVSSRTELTLLILNSQA